VLLAFRWPVADDHEISCAWFAARANLAAVQAEPDRQPRSRSSKRSAKCPGTVIAVRIAGASRIGTGRRSSATAGSTRTSLPRSPS